MCTRFELSSEVYAALARRVGILLTSSLLARAEPLGHADPPSFGSQARGDCQPRRAQTVGRPLRSMAADRVKRWRTRCWCIRAKIGIRPDATSSVARMRASRTSDTNRFHCVGHPA